MKDYQIQRLTSFLDPQNDALSAGYNRLQAEIAIGSGGLTGRGYLKGSQTNLNFVPAQRTDFIFTVVGEEFGFAGAMVLLGLFALLLWRAFRIALLAKDPFGTFVAVGRGHHVRHPAVHQRGHDDRDHADHRDPAARSCPMAGAP